MKLKGRIPLFLLRNAFKLVSRKFFYLLAFILTTDWILDNFDLLPSLPPAEDLMENAELEQANWTQITINKLLANLNISLKKSADRVNDKTNDWKDFTYKKAVCESLVLAEGQHNRFSICYPPKLRWRLLQWFAPLIQIFVGNVDIRQAFPGNLAYFINCRRDLAFESNLKRTMPAQNRLKVFTGEESEEDSSANHAFKPDLIEKLEVKIFVDRESEMGADKQVGIKDLLDLHGDYHRIEFLKFEMKSKTDPLVFAVNIPVFAAHLLLRLEDFSSRELQHLLHRLAQSLYFPYAIEKQRLGNGSGNVLFVSLVHKYSMYKYAFSDELITAHLSPSQSEDQTPT